MSAVETPLLNRQREQSMLTLLSKPNSLPSGADAWACAPTGVDQDVAFSFFASAISSSLRLLQFPAADDLDEGGEGLGGLGEEVGAVFLQPLDALADAFLGGDHRLVAELAPCLLDRVVEVASKELEAVLVEQGRLLRRCQPVDELEDVARRGS